MATSAAALVAVASSPAPADPATEEFSFQLTCDGQTYDVVTNGNGDFTPAHDTNSNAVFVPTSFGPFHGTVTDSSGTVLDDFTEPGGAKGKSEKPRKSSATCIYEFHETFFDPELGEELTFDGSGSVTGFRTPAR